MHFSSPILLAALWASTPDLHSPPTSQVHRPARSAAPQWSIEGAYLWHGFRHSGALVGAQLELGRHVRHRFAVALMAGVMHKRGYQTTIVAYPRIGYRFNGRTGFTFGVFAGAGYGHRFLPEVVYERRGSEIRHRRDRGRALLVTSGELEFGWNLKPQTGVPLTFFVRPQVLGRSPVNRTVSLHIGSQIGVSYAF